ncbi:class I SAM-dependent methyltransferase [Actinomyces sp. B33]|uniref:methyltransferase n=1 Tax=Actinomyces sp. B33 TaxID=2942131 RepID=UPI00233FD7CF|nr:methyltransferase [Actinomyces sp. B33]MDC4232403.1 class I SAM-dependent methyltransferase [Actinomyces sp. B33]
MTQTPVPALDADLIEALRADLVAADWTGASIDALLSDTARDALDRAQRVPALVELDGRDEPAAILTRFFLLGAAETADSLDAALPGLGAAGAIRLGLAAQPPAERAPSPDTPAAGTHPSRGLIPLVDLRPHDVEPPEPEAPGGARPRTWWIASDLGQAQTGRPLAPDHVMGVGGATRSLLALTIRRPVGSALDLGCGCGIQALALASHADRVVATDLSERACAFTSFNAALNGVSLDVRVGSLFEPVADEAFDLIVTNPPFVITPESVRSSGGVGVLEYRDAGMSRDRLVETLIRQAPARLTAGGVLQMLANWEIPADADPDADWSARIDRWLEDLPVDAWVVQRDVVDTARYVEMWIRDGGSHLDGREAYERTYERWLADFARAGVGAVGMGFIAVRRIDEAGAADAGDGAGQGVRSYDFQITGAAPVGADAERALDALRLPEDLWGLVLVRAPDVTEERHYVPGSPDPTVMILHQGAALGRSIRVGTAASAVVGACDGELTCGQIAAAVALLTDRAPDEVRDEVGPVLRDLIRAGMLSVATGQ